MNTPGAVFGRSLSFPPRIGPDGRTVWSEGEANIRESIRVTLLTDLRERVRLPDFGGGLTHFLFEPNNVATRHLVEERIKGALKRWEPRITVQDTSVDEDPDDPEAAIAVIRYQLVATQARDNVTLSVRLAG